MWSRVNIGDVTAASGAGADTRSGQFMRNVRRQARWLIAVGVIWPTPALLAQTWYDSVRTATGWCHVWQASPGFSEFPRDASYSRCALDRPPVLRDAPALPQPGIGQYAAGSFLMVVNADGTANQDLTRDYTMGLDSAFHRRALETLRRWRFKPGIRKGKAVRSAFELTIESNQRNDTLPARLEWRYTAGAGAEPDKLLGTWVVEPALPQFPAERIDSIHAAVLRQLVRTRVLQPGNGRRYCLIMPNGDSAARARGVALMQRTSPELASGMALASAGCERVPGTLRIALRDVHRTENGRTVVYVSGDYLPHWPSDLDGRPWRSWNSRCVGEASEQRVESVAVSCDIAPGEEPDAMKEWAARWNPSARKPGGRSGPPDSLHVTLYVTTQGAHLVDTLRAVVAQLPHLDQHAIVDRDPPCGGWSAHSANTASTLYVISGDPDDTRLFVTQVQTSTPPDPHGAPVRCRPQDAQKEFATFLLGDVGDPATAPITLCFERCARTYVLDPARHTLATRSHLSFRLADLRPDTRLGSSLRFRIAIDSPPTNLLPLVIVTSGKGSPSSVWIAQRVDPGMWDYPVFDGGGYPPDTEVHLYLIAR